MSSNNDVDTPSSEHFIGRIKWFNNKAGYGFITVTDGSHAGSDIFVHHSAIEVENQQYKYLVQGEYVEFGLIKTTSGDHELQASNVNGIKGGKLMCETRHELKLARTNYKSDNNHEITMPRQQSAPRDTSQTSSPKDSSKPRVRGGGPKEWTLVNSKGKGDEPLSKSRTTRKSQPKEIQQSVN